MSAVETAVAPSGAPTKSKPRRIHYANRDDVTAAFEMGVQVRMYCGFWKFPAGPEGVLTPIKRPADFTPAADCKRCMAVARAMARRRGIA